MSKSFVAKEKIQETIRRWKLFNSNDVVLVAVSGGIDSVALLHLVSRLPPKLRPRIVAAYFNHRLRPESGFRGKIRKKYVQTLENSLFRRTS